MSTNNNKPIILDPGEVLSEEFKNKIREMNAGKPDFQTYTRRVREVFNLAPITINKTKSIFLAGFIEGEGSISVSVKKNDNAKFGIELDPNFNITQHINGVNHLYFALEVFQTGRIRYKAGSNATLVFIIEPRRSLTEKVCPFFKEYVYDLSSPAKQRKFDNFLKMLNLFDENAHLIEDRFINELLPIWDSIRGDTQKGYKGETFQSLEEAQNFVRTSYLLLPKGVRSKGRISPKGKF